MTGASSLTLAAFSPLSQTKLDGLTVYEMLAVLRRAHPDAVFDDDAVVGQYTKALSSLSGKGVFPPAATQALKWAKEKGIKLALVSRLGESGQSGNWQSVAAAALRTDVASLLSGSMFDHVRFAEGGELSVECFQSVCAAVGVSLSTNSENDSNFPRVVACLPAVYSDAEGLGGSLASIGIETVPVMDALDVTQAFLARLSVPRGSLPPLIPRLRIVIPMAGLGSRFEKEGFSIQKPFLPTIEGNQLWTAVVENLMPKEEPLRSATEVHIVVRADQVANFTAPPHVTMHTVEKLTEGPACTVLSVESIINDDVPLMIGNSDQFLEWDSDAFYAAAFHPDFDGAISTFIHPRPDDLKWSYASTDPSTGAVSRVAEKVYVGPYATTGLYAWKKGSDFVNHAKAMIAANIRVNNEFYVCPVYNTAMDSGLKYRIINCDRFWGVGIPDDYNAWLDGYVPREMGFHDALSRKYAAMWCKWGSRVPTPQPNVASDPSLCACMWSTGAFHLTPSLTALKEALSPWAHKAQWFDAQPGLGLAPQGPGSISGNNAPTSYAAAAARPRAVLHHTFFQFHTFSVGLEAKEALPLSAWAAAARGAMDSLPPYYLTLTGCAPVRSGIVACGYPPCDYLSVRQAIRGVGPCKEPHAQDIHHVTLLRWTSPLSPGENNAVRAVLERWRHTPLGMFQPSQWNVGLATWAVRPEQIHPVVSWRSPPAPWVLHRGNTSGLSPATENDPRRLAALVKEGWDVEIDLWRCTGEEACKLAEAGLVGGHVGEGALSTLKTHCAATGKMGRVGLWLGHDAPVWPLEREDEGDGGLLSSRGVWIHCKNLAAFAYLRSHTRSPAFNFFLHDKDEAALTSKGYMWGYPGIKVPGPGTVSVVWPKDKSVKAEPGVGVCWDWLPKDVTIEF